MGASPGGTRHWISRDLIFQFMLSNARPVGHKVSIIYVLIMDEPPLLLLQKALHLTLLQADDAAGPLSAQLLPDGYLVPPELRRLREHFVTRLWFQTLEASPFWAQLYLGMLVLHLCQPWGWSGEKKCSWDWIFNITSSVIAYLLTNYWGCQGVLFFWVTKVHSDNRSSYLDLQIWLDPNAFLPGCWMMNTEAVTLYGCFYQHQDTPSSDKVNLEVQVISTELEKC